VRGRERGESGEEIRKEPPRPRRLVGQPYYPTRGAANRRHHIFIPYFLLTRNPPPPTTLPGTDTERYDASPFDDEVAHE